MISIINILIVEDDKSIVKILTKYFEKHGMNVACIGAVEELDSDVLRNTPEIILLDFFLPNVQGFSLLERLRVKYPNSGIIVMTGNDDPVDKVVGLEIGADDYINKPFEMREMLARVRSLYRRVTKDSAKKIGEGTESSEKVQYFTFNGWRYELRTKFLYSPDGKVVKLTSFETQLLAIFLNSENRVIERITLLKDVLMREWRPEDRSIDMLVSKLRKKLHDKEVVVNERNRGYRWTPLTLTKYVTTE